MSRGTTLVAAVTVLLGVFAMPDTADARCECRCVNGQVVPLCDSAIDIPPICPPRVCPIVTPSVDPIDLPRVPPVGTRGCRSEQVYDSATGGYVWREVCR